MGIILSVGPTGAGTRVPASNKTPECHKFGMAY